MGVGGGGGGGGGVGCVTRGRGLHLGQQVEEGRREKAVSFL